MNLDLRFLLYDNCSVSEDAANEFAELMAQAGFPAKPTRGGFMNSPDAPQILAQFVAWAGSSGAALGIYKLLQIWSSRQSGRSIKVHIGNISVEATGVTESEFLAFLDRAEKIDRERREQSKLPPPSSSYDGPPCPYCGKPLATARAKQCPHCAMDWHDPQNPKSLKKESKPDSVQRAD